MSRVTDQAQRIQALDTERSFIVSAPAGSGKTGLLPRESCGYCALSTTQKKF